MNCKLHGANNSCPRGWVNNSLCLTEKHNLWTLWKSVHAKVGALFALRLVTIQLEQELWVVHYTIKENIVIFHAIMYLQITIMVLLYINLLNYLKKTWIVDCYWTSSYKDNKFAKWSGTWKFYSVEVGKIKSITACYTRTDSLADGIHGM